MLAKLAFDRSVQVKNDLNMSKTDLGVMGTSIYTGLTIGTFLFLTCWCCMGVRMRNYLVKSRQRKRRMDYILSIRRDMMEHLFRQEAEADAELFHNPLMDKVHAQMKLALKDSELSMAILRQQDEERDRRD